MKYGVALIVLLVGLSRLSEAKKRAGHTKNSSLKKLDDELSAIDSAADDGQKGASENEENSEVNVIVDSDEETQRESDAEQDALANADESDQAAEDSDAVDADTSDAKSDSDSDDQTTTQVENDESENRDDEKQTKSKKDETAKQTPKKEKSDDVPNIVKRVTINSYAKRFSYNCPRGRSFSFLSTSHSNRFQDREWSALCDTKIPRRYIGPGSWSTQYSYDNEYDATLRAVCPEQHVLTGFAGSALHGKHKDRKYKIYCTHVWHHKHISCRWQTWINPWDGCGNIDMHKRPGYYMTGLYSIHSNKYEDRRWMVYMCKLRKI